MINVYSLFNSNNTIRSWSNTESEISAHMPNVGDRLTNTFAKDFYVQITNISQDKAKKKLCCVSDLPICI